MPRKNGNTSEVILAFVNGDSHPYRTSSENVYHYSIEAENGNHYSVLFSYGVHFPMCIKGDFLNGKTFFLINGDRYSITTAVHQGTLQNSIRGEEYGTTSFSALYNAIGGWMRAETIIDNLIQVVDYDEDETGYELPIPDGATPHYDKDGNLKFWHRPGGLLLLIKGTDGPRLLLCGMDEQSYFISELSDNKPSTIAEGFEALKPEPVIQALEKGLEVRRQGEWFFIPHVTGKDFAFYKQEMEIWNANKAIYGHKYNIAAERGRFELPNSDGGNVHHTTRGMVAGWKLLVAGTVKHRQTQNAEI
jgi:hypothetical protein